MSHSRLGVFLSLFLTASAGSQVLPPPTELVFDRFSNRVVKIEVEESGSAAKASIGSGLFVSPDGHLITNYHVISQVVQHPERYQAHFVGADDEEVPVSVLNVDVAHDLALVKTDLSTPSHFVLGEFDAPQGLRLYSMGHPLDLGLNIVEGTYNGFLKHSLDRRIHFTGSLNPGMSGGPAITADGRVVGINVASAGEQVSFLVPVERAVALVDRSWADDFETPSSLLDLVRDQIDDYQRNFYSVLLDSTPPTIALGVFSVPTQPAAFFNCWADAYREDSVAYETVDHQCSTVDYIFISDELVSGRFWFYHRLIESDELNRFQFDTLYTDDFQQTYHGMGGGESEVTEFRCHSGAIREHRLAFKTVFCLRGYKKLPELYDLVFKAAVVGKPLIGLETALFASGLSFDNAEALVRWYMGAVAWNETE
ncbi:MAG TPA: serine protease [Vicinamibacteria bacterium]|nr:serine protease [Vicinamibacteria bacterium]